MKKTKIVRNIILIIVLIATVISLIIFFNSKPKEKSSADSQNIFRVQKIDLYDSVNIVGKCVSDTIVPVFSDVFAPVSEVCIKKGDYVNEGDVICKLDVSDYEKRRDDYTRLLEEYEKYNALKKDNYLNNLTCNSEIVDKQISQLEDTINKVRIEYENEVNNGNDIRQKYESALAELENIKNEYSSANAEFELQESIFNEYEATQKAKQEAEADVNDVPEGNEGEEDITDADDSNEISFDIENFISLKNRKIKLEQLKELAQNKVDFYDKMQSESLSVASELKSELEKTEFECEQLKIQKKYNSEFTADEYAQSVSVMDSESLYKEQVEILNKKISGNEIKATASGIVTDLNVSVGDYVSEKNVCMIQDQQAMHFEAYVNPNKISMISKDNRISISMAANNYEQIEGKILDIGEFYDAENNGYKVSFTFDNINDMDIFPGFEAAAKIILVYQEDTLAVPYDAIIEKDDKYYVKKVNMNDNSVKEVEVEKGLETDYYIAVSSDEIKENDRVLTGVKQ